MKDHNFLIVSHSLQIKAVTFQIKTVTELNANRLVSFFSFFDKTWADSNEKLIKTWHRHSYMIWETFCCPVAGFQKTSQTLQLLPFAYIRHGPIKFFRIAFLLLDTYNVNRKVPYACPR